jgi:uncharacterized protein
MPRSTGLVAGVLGPLELLVVQPTPFCNLDCSYCYLPSRQATDRMSVVTLQALYDWVFASGLVRQQFTLLWHAGEPLVVPIAFYEEAIDRLLASNNTPFPVDHSFQTNATLITPAWCEFIRRRNIFMGVSVDGPAFLHDRCRRTRQGKGTFERVIRGIELLNAHEIPFHVITVLTAESLDYPDELFDFYQQYGMRNVGFNVEEIEGPNASSSLSGPDTPERFRRFLTRFVELATQVDSPLSVREFDTSLAALASVRYGPGSRVQENQPFAILNVEWSGNFSTYSPELLGLDSLRHGSFALGHVEKDSLESVVNSEHFQRLEAEIGAGVSACQQSCKYFPYCGGGPPGNKYFENGSFASTETLFCRLHKQVCLDVGLQWLERRPRQPVEAGT